MLNWLPRIKLIPKDQATLSHQSEQLREVEPRVLSIVIPLFIMEAWEVDILPLSLEKTQIIVLLTIASKILMSKEVHHFSVKKSNEYLSDYRQDLENIVLFTII